ncbi:MAG: DMT family transporter [Clostridia bacterium]
MKKLKGYLPYLAGIAISIIFGLSFLFTKQGLDDFSPMVLLSYRFGIAAVIIGLLTITGIIKVNFKGKSLKGIIILALFHPTVYFSMEAIGIKYTSSSEAGIMIALIPIVVMVLARIFLNERPSNIQKLFIMVSVLGVIFIILMSENLNIQGQLIGIIALLTAVFAGSVFSVLSRKLSKNFTSIEITFVMIMFGAVFFNLIAVIKGLMDGDLYNQYITPMTSLNGAVAVLYLGVISSIIAFFMQNYMLSKLQATNTSVFTNLTTIISIAAGTLIRHEAFYWYQLIGGIFIILGVWGTNFFSAEPQKSDMNKQAEI